MKINIFHVKILKKKKMSKQIRTFLSSLFLQLFDFSNLKAVYFLHLCVVKICMYTQLCFSLKSLARIHKAANALQISEGS